MNRAKKTPLVWVALGLLVVLVAINVALLILLHTGGPLIGVAFYAVLLVALCRGKQHGNRDVTVGGLIGLIVHVVEVIALGWSHYPAWMALNIVLPAALASVAWLADRQAKRRIAS